MMTCMDSIWIDYDFRFSNFVHPNWSIKVGQIKKKRQNVLIIKYHISFILTTKRGNYPLSYSLGSCISIFCQGTIDAMRYFNRSVKR